MLKLVSYISRAKFQQHCIEHWPRDIDLNTDVLQVTRYVLVAMSVLDIVTRGKRNG